MNIQIIVALIFFLSIYSNSPHSSSIEEKIIQSEAEDYCSCYSTFKKKEQKAKNKAERKSKRSDRPRKYSPDMKLFGGTKIDFNFQKCMNKKRSRKTKKYLNALHKKDRKALNKKIKRAIKKQCPKSSVAYY